MDRHDVIWRVVRDGQTIVRLIPYEVNDGEWKTLLDALNGVE